MQSSPVLLDIRENVAFMTLNRPEILNALNLEMARALMNVAIECDGHPDVRAVVLTGAGSTFCAGGDLKSFIAQGEHLPTHLKEVTTFLHTAVSYLAHMK